MDRPWQDEDRLKTLYIQKGLTTTEIADELDCGTGTVSRWLGKHDIESRNKGPKHKYPKLTDYEWLRGQYVENQKTAYEIAEQVGCSDVNVYYWLNKHGISVRDEHNGQVPTDKRLTNESWLREKHYDEGWSYVRIARECGVSISNVCYWMDRHGLEYQLKDRKHYGPNWKEQREKRLERDGYECVVCGMNNDLHKEKYGCALSCHHIRPLRSFEEGGEIDHEKANDIENLITVCKKCHTKWEGVPLRPDI